MGDGVATEAREAATPADPPAVELRRISVSGFKSIRRIDRLELRPINVLIGPNGSGKSNFIGVFSLMRAYQEGGLEEYVAREGGAAKILHFGPKVTHDIGIRVEFGREGVICYDLRLWSAADDALVASTGDGGPVGANGVFSTHSKFSPRDFLDQIIGRVQRWRVYHFHDTGPDSPLKRTAALDDNRLLRPDGANLAAFLYRLKERYPDSYDLIRRTIQLAAPFFEDFQLAPRALNTDTIRLEWRHKSSDMYFGASSLSDGTLRFIALATLFLQPEELRPSVIIVDEPELGLHPAAITAFAALVRQASFTTQVILATQSSLLLDQFEPEDVLVAERVDGGTTLRRLDAGRLREWLEEYSLGELWEKNELGGRPAPG